MSDATTEAVAGLLDADPDEFDDKEAFREFVSGQLAELSDRDESQDARLGALSRKVERFRAVAEDAQQRAERAEAMAAWGGLRYEDRLSQVVETLIRRARQSDGKAHITTTEEARKDAQGNRYDRPGVYNLFDGSVSERTCRNYVDVLAGLDGLYVGDSSPGGWGGGSEPKRLKINLSRFLNAYGPDWSIDSLLDDVGGGDDG